MTTVQELLDQLVEGKIGLEEVSADFAQRSWPQPKPATDAQVWGVTDFDGPDPNSWAAVDACSALTTTQYRALADAKARAK